MAEERVDTLNRLGGVVPDMESTTLHVEGMSCAGCEQTVSEAVSALDGVVAVSADREEGVVRIDHEEATTDADSFAGTIEDAGYQVVDA